jgi:MioC protein
MASIQIFIGSCYGAAEQVAQLAAEKLQSLGHKATLNSYPRPQDLINYCSATPTQGRVNCRIA